MNIKQMLKSGALVAGGIWGYDAFTYGNYSRPIDNVAVAYQKATEPIDTTVDGFVKPVLGMYSPTEPFTKTVPGVVEMVGLAGLVIGAAAKKREETENKKEK